MRMIERYGQQNAMPLSSIKRSEAVTAKGAASKGPAAPQPAAGEKVTLSAKARELSQQSALGEVKVQRLRSAIAGGTFKVDPQAIADKLVEENGI